MMKQERPFLKGNGRFLLGAAAAAHPATGFVDGNYRLQNTQTPGEPGISHFSYHYDALGNIGRIYDATHRDNQTFRYDHLNRLTEAAGGTVVGSIGLGLDLNSLNEAYLSYESDAIRDINLQVDQAQNTFWSYWLTQPGPSCSEINLACGF